MADRYQIVTLVGEGGMGEVYEAEDLELQERVALKAIQTKLLRDSNALERFRREILLARRVTHPNVCRLFDLVWHRDAGGADVTLLTMELLSGESLSKRLDRTGRLSEAETLRVASDVASGLDAMHGAGVVHRDLKTANVFLTGGAELESPGRAVITDFGLARALTCNPDSTGSTPPRRPLRRLTGVNHVLGSPAYMSPEQVLGRDVTPTTDIYSLGVILFEALTGRKPFEGDAPMVMAFRKVQEDPPSPRDLRPDLSPAWEPVILRCLSRDPAARFSDGRSVVDALGGADGLTPRP